MKLDRMIKQNKVLWKNDVAISQCLHIQNYDKLIRQFMMEESKLKDWFIDRHWKKHAFDIEIVSCKTLQPKFYDRWNEIILLYHLQYSPKKLQIVRNDQW